MHPSLCIAGTCLLVAAVDARSSAFAADDAPPNFVFIIVDDMGWADLGCYGSEAIQTPHADRTAAEGLRFTDAYSGCTVCAPARSTLMTGYHMGHTSVRSNAGGVPLLDEDVTLAEVLQQAGYAVGGFGKWGLGDIHTSGAAQRQGFDTFFGYYHQVHAHDFYPDYLILDGEHFPLPGNQRASENGQGGVSIVDPETGAERQFSQYLIFERMQQFIRENSEGPFFCYAPWTPPHAQYEIPEDDPAWQLYRDRDWPVEAKVHAAFVSLVDRHLGETLATLDELGIAERTLVFFCSDNGASQRFEGTLNSSGPLRGNKRAMYEGGLRTPLIARWPGTIEPGTESDLPCYFPDVMPTLAELAGAGEHVPDDIDGISIVPTLRGDPEEQQRHDYLYWEYSQMRWGRDPQMLPEKTAAAIRRDDWKAVRQTMTGPIELYDLSVDVGEEHDLAGQHPDLVERLAELFASAHVPPRPQPEPEHPSGRRFN